MKIAICYHHVNNLGGIINHGEQLGAGLQEIGHVVDLFVCLNATRAKRSMSPRSVQEQSLFAGCLLDQDRGWDLPSERQLLYGDKIHAEISRKILDNYDLVIWTVPVPTKQKANQGNNLWPMLYEKPANQTQIAVIHDGYAHDMYPYIKLVAKQFDFFAPCHAASFNSISKIGGNIVRILNPQDNHQLPKEFDCWDRRIKGFVAPQMFKAWKRVPELIAAIRYMSTDISKVVAGVGIDQCYLTSVDKCKYFHKDGERVWEAAMANGMEYKGLLSSQSVTSHLSHYSVMIDNCHSNRMASQGGVFNRTIGDAWRCGAIPILRPHGCPSGNPELITGENHYSIPMGATYQEIAEHIESVIRMPKYMATRMQKAGLEACRQLDRKKIAEKFVSLTATPIIDVTKIEYAKMCDKGRSILTDFFNITE